MSSSNGDAGKKPEASGGRGPPTIREVSDRNDPPRGLPGAGGSGSHSDDPRDYYTGGEKSGMLVEDLTKRKHADSIFEQALEMGAQQVPLPSFDGRSSSSRSFTGRGRLLSGDAQTTPSIPKPPQDVLHNIHCWDNGFTIDDGPLRSYDDPENAEFIESIRKSQCPQELEPAERRTSVRVNIIKQRTDYEGVGITVGGGSAPGPSRGPAAVTRSCKAREMGVQQAPMHPFDRSFTEKGQMISWDAPTEPVVQHLFKNVLLWNNGFTIDDGPARGYHDPRNTAFIESIKKFQFPQELQPADPRISVHLNIVKRNADYVGVGRTLVGGSGADHSPAPTVRMPIGSVGDNTQPCTSTQLRIIGEEQFLELLKRGQWESAETHLRDVLQADLMEHPMPFLKIRRLELIRMIDFRKFSDAVTHCEVNIRGPFQKVIEKGEKGLLHYASESYIRREINLCSVWAETRTRTSHVYQTCQIVKEFAFNYLRLHVPQRIGYEIPKNLTGVYWHFGIEIPKKIPSHIKRSFRCMACSEKDFHGQSITELQHHLSSCLMMGSPYLKSLLTSLVPTEPRVSQQVVTDQITSEQGVGQTNRQEETGPITSEQGVGQTNRQEETGPITSEEEGICRITYEHNRQEMLHEFDIVSAALGNLPDSPDAEQLRNSFMKIKYYADALHATKLGPGELWKSAPGIATSKESASQTLSDVRPSALSVGNVHPGSLLSSGAPVFGSLSSNVQSPSLSTSYVLSPSSSSSHALLPRTNTPQAPLAETQLAALPENPASIDDEALKLRLGLPGQR